MTPSVRPARAGLVIVVKGDGSIAGDGDPERAFWDGVWRSLVRAPHHAQPIEETHAMSVTRDPLIPGTPRGSWNEQANDPARAAEITEDLLPPQPIAYPTDYVSAVLEGREIPRVEPGMIDARQYDGDIIELEIIVGTSLDSLRDVFNAMRLNADDVFAIGDPHFSDYDGMWVQELYLLRPQYAEG